jgi:hypothetical protein
VRIKQGTPVTITHLRGPTRRVVVDSPAGTLKFWTGDRSSAGRRLPDGRAICIARSLEPRIVIINTRNLR